MHEFHEILVLIANPLYLGKPLNELAISIISISFASPNMRAYHLTWLKGYYKKLSIIQKTKVHMGCFGEYRYPHYQNSQEYSLDGRVIFQQ